MLDPNATVPREQLDLLVLGTGLAGMSAAFSAHEYGAKVTVIDKAAETSRSGNTRSRRASSERRRRVRGTMRVVRRSARTDGRDRASTNSPPVASAIRERAAASIDETTSRPSCPEARRPRPGSRSASSRRTCTATSVRRPRWPARSCGPPIASRTRALCLPTRRLRGGLLRRSPWSRLSEGSGERAVEGHELIDLTALATAQVQQVPGAECRVPLHQ